jgi:hypothetical protein
MSAFQCSNYHISCIVHFALAKSLFRNRSPFSYWPGEGGHRKTPSAMELGQLLVNANAESVAYRYREEAQKIAFGPHEFYQPISAIQCLAAISCLVYQSCERDDWYQSEAKHALDAIKDLAINCLDGYDKADAWELRPKQVAA